MTSALSPAGRSLALARLVRLPNVFTAMADIFLGGMVTGAVTERTFSFALLLISSSCFYMAGMVWNDFFDLEQDRKERPFRPLPSGQIQTYTAAVIGILLIALGLTCAMQADPDRWRALTISVFLVPVIILYDAWLKHSWLGPVAMGTCRFLNVLLGLSIAPVEVGGWGIFLALSIGVYIAGVTWFARTEAGLSRQNSLLAAAVVMAAGLLLGLAVPALAEDAEIARSTWPLFPYLLVAFGFFIGIPVARAIEKPTPARVQPAVKRCVLGLILFDAILATSLIGATGILLAILLIPAIYLGRFVYST
jgi:4-hydroxybenzoate polyprenyltransferase